MTTANQDRVTPPTRKGQQTRMRIIEAAARLMFLKGVERTTLDEALAAAGVGKSQMYHYFKDKDDLVTAVIAYQTDQTLSPEGPHLAPLDSWDAWRRWRDAVVALQADAYCIGGCPVGSLASELNDSNEAARKQLTRSFERWHALFQAGIEAMRQRGLMTKDADSEALAMAVLAALQGGLLLCQTWKRTAPLEKALDGALLLLERYATDGTATD